MDKQSIKQYLTRTVAVYLSHSHCENDNTTCKWISFLIKLSKVNFKMFAFQTVFSFTFNEAPHTFILYGQHFTLSYFAYFVFSFMKYITQ